MSDLTELSIVELENIITQAERELARRQECASNGTVRLRACTGSFRDSMQYRRSGQVYIGDEPLYKSNVAAKEGSPEWDDTRSRSRKHGGLTATQVYAVPADATLRIAFTRWRGGYPNDKTERELLASEITERIAHTAFSSSQ